MNVSFSKDADGLGLLTLEFTDQDFAAEYRKALRSYAAKANVKGFRPGKVPEQIVEKMYGKGLRAEALNDKINNTINDYVKENKLHILAEIHPKGHHEPNPEDKSFKLEYEIAVEPEFTLPDLGTVDLPKYQLQYDDEQARQEIDSIRKRSGKLQEQETIGADSIIYAEYVKEGEEPKKTYLSAERMTEEGRAAFSGKKVGEEASVNLQQAFSEDELRKVLFLSKEEDITPTGTANFKIEKIQNFALPELDQNFVVEKLGVEYHTDEAEVVKNYQAKMAENSRGGVEYVEQAQALATLRDLVSIPLPENFLRHMVEHQYAHQEKPLTDEDFAREMRAVRNSLILDKLAEQLEIQVDFEDVVAETMNAIVGSGYYGGGAGGDEELRNMAVRLLSQKDRQIMNEMAGRARMNKILGAATEKMTRSDRSVSHQEMQDIANRY